ncbi:MAG: D-glycero-beta-D-manno-heptose 1,7-bisphosphate 7-phosphatase [Thermodesulfobacteriota bacterium]
MKRAVFLDRDGTINVEREYLSSPDGLVLIDGAAEAVRMINEAGLLAVVITNQSGIGRGYFTEEAVDAIHRRLSEIVGKGGGHIDAFYHCPHHPDEGCRCRKPATGLIERAAEELGIDPANSYVVGDKAIDVELARKCSAKGVLVLTGYGTEQQGWIEPPPDFIAQDLLAAAEWIVEDVERGMAEGNI